ncbi:MAG: tRNA 2-thiouridine(34) synthase MnmA [Actinobacteria bacterium RBG_16_67_15]|nr:MAG: tRNA 2-thiouridine(34) synthase MnmA [Actinobacteria bacterium RBG_16_67_15]
MKALVAMSGGVDSSVAAALMLEAGYEVIGVTLKQWVAPDGSLPTAGCCTVADAEDARKVAARLGIPHYVLDHSAEFTAEVVDRFVADYAAGLTPNPCVECNRRVRFGALLGRVEPLGCDVLVTGHYARIGTRRGRPALLRAADPAKDQSYVLHMLTAADLARVRFPIGDLTKAEVRDHASRLGLRTAAKPDSQDLCFVAGDYRAFLQARLPEIRRPGAMVDASGAVVGKHDGVAGFTVGQRRGLGIAVGEPRFVVAVDPATATVRVGPRSDLAVAACRVSGVHFVNDPVTTGEAVAVKVRYRSRPVPARLFPQGEVWRVAFTTPQEAVAPGQAAVFYRDDEVLGGGTITATESS